MFLSIKYAGWFMRSNIGELERYHAISRDLLNVTNTGQVPACSQEPVDSTDANIVETYTCLETAQQETTNFTVWLLIESDLSMFSCAPECSKQLPLWKYIANWGVLWHHIDAEISPKAASEKAQTTVSESRYTSPKIDVFRMIILTLLVPIGDNAQVSFLVHQVLRTSATV